MTLLGGLPMQLLLQKVRMAGHKLPVVVNPRNYTSNQISSPQYSTECSVSTDPIPLDSPFTMGLISLRFDTPGGTRPWRCLSRRLRLMYLVPCLGHRL